VREHELASRKLNVRHGLTSAGVTLKRNDTCFVPWHARTVLCHSLAARWSTITVLGTCHWIASGAFHRNLDRSKWPTRSSDFTPIDYILWWCYRGRVTGRSQLFAWSALQKHWCSSTCNCADVKKHLDSDRTSVGRLLRRKGRRGEMSGSADVTQYLANSYTFPLKQPACIFTGCEVIQPLFRRCSLRTLHCKQFCQWRFRRADNAHMVCPLSLILLAGCFLVCLLGLPSTLKVEAVSAIFTILHGFISQKTESS
jgi:hypothetical protein